jgi:hypothetical protein
MAVCGLAGAAGAQTIPVTNFDFEDPAQSAGGFTLSAPGWTPVGGGGDWGVFYPTVATWGYVTSLHHQLFYTNGTTVEQTLAATAQVNTTYTLQVDVINRPNFSGHSYFIELYAGSTLLRRDNNGLAPPVGGFLTSSLYYTVNPGDPVIGQPLRIRLGGANQTNFDNVRLSTGGCYANCDGSSTPPILNVNDFVCFQSAFAAGSPYANCDGSTSPPVLNISDFVCFQGRFAAGCG